MGLASLLKKQYAEVIGGVAPAGAASASGDISQMIKQILVDLGAVSGAPMPPLIGPASSEPMASQIMALGRAYVEATNTAWPSANMAVGYPFIVTSGINVKKLWVYNGVTLSGNIDIGIYTEAYARVVAMGSTAQAGAGEVQELNIADTDLDAGLYYMVMAVSNTTATTRGFAAAVWSTRLAETMGMFQMAAAFPLPATITPAVPTTTTSIPLFGAATRTLVT